MLEHQEEVDGTGLKYPTPDLSDVNVTDFLTSSELNTLMDDMPTDCDLFERYAIAQLEKAKVEGTL